VSTRSERRRQAQGKQGGSNMTRLYLILGAVAVAGVGIVGYSVGQANSGAATMPVTIEGLDEDMELLAEMAQGVTKGQESAPVTIIEFGDYQCPSCMAFWQQTKPLMEATLVETGTARFTYYDFPITSAHPNAFLAARAARCADDQDRYWDYHDQLFRTQPRWSALTNPAGLFEEYARSLDMDDGAFESCLNSDRHAELVTANMQLGEVLGVGGTPTVLVEYQGSVRPVPPTVQAIQEHIDGLLSGESESPS
jgi:protein-disulfide isomerase